MINITCRKETYRYNSYHIAKAFFPLAEISTVVDEACAFDVICMLENDKMIEITGQEKSEIDRRLYSELKGVTGKALPWGLLMGIRPVKLAGAEMENGSSFEEASNWLQSEKLVSKEKADLACRIAEKEKSIVQSVKEHANGKGSYSIYVGIPFCPSVCSYCSFSSGPVEKWKGIVESYVSMLCREVHEVAGIMSGKSLSTIYIGGGTPTSLKAEQLEKLLKCIRAEFSAQNPIEFTLEAGRPDSIDREKLEIAKAYGITRLSINPQTMQQKTLDAIGRKHSVKQVYEAYELARSLGFDNINMDLIAGLKGENAQDMADTLRQIKELLPDNLTVHCLAIKRAAKETQQETEAGEILKMTGEASEIALSMGLEPYYLYRQKNIAADLENTGYAIPGKEGIYNIMIMEEQESIIACGAGAQSKLVLTKRVPSPVRGRGQLTNIIRFENMKKPDLYIERFDEMLDEKRKMVETYSEFI